ncbi:unnamed protein product [Mucor hiemalis]
MVQLVTYSRNIDYVRRNRSSNTSTNAGTDLAAETKNDALNWREPQDYNFPTTGIITSSKNDALQLNRKQFNVVPTEAVRKSQDGTYQL